MTKSFIIRENHSIYQIYYDSVISIPRKKFSKADLEILKGFIFAKHNSSFDNEFFQAYFSIFTFYNDEKQRKSRVPQSNKLLTATDKKNLEIVTKALENLK